MAKRQKKHRRMPDDATTRLSLHERLALTRVREMEKMINLHGEEWAEERRGEYVERLDNEASGAKQRESGHNSPGPRGKYKKVTALDGTVSRVSPKKVVALVQEMQNRHKDRTWNDVCTEVAKKVGYKSVESVRRRVRNLKWDDPRRAKRDTK